MTTCRTRLGRARFLVVLVGAPLALSGCQDSKSKGPSAPKQEGAKAMAIKIESEAFGPHQPIPKKYTGEGADVSPPLRWSGVPDEARQLALIMDDPDAPRDEPWVHWVLYKIAPKTDQLPEGIEKTEQPKAPAGAMQGKNSWGKIGYGGPMPPPGHGVHHYHFKLYALDTELAAKPGLTKDELLEAMDDHIVAQGELIGTYQR